MLTISSVEALSDNYIWVLHNQTDAIAVDPGDAAPLVRFLEAHQLTLCAVLVTHKHHDHIGGLDDLLRRVPDVRIFGPASLPQVNEVVDEGSTISLLGEEWSVMAIPGHTQDHLAYYAAPRLFCGDTLFAAGCGRVFEGTPQALYASLYKLAALPPETQVYCAHEYTLSNLAFAQQVEPSNPDIKQRLIQEKSRRDKDLPTLPSTLALECATNPFLRTACENVQTAVSLHAGRKIMAPDEIFAVMRAWKDGFRNVID